MKNNKKQLKNKKNNETQTQKAIELPIPCKTSGKFIFSSSQQSKAMKNQWNINMCDLPAFKSLKEPMKNEHIYFSICFTVPSPSLPTLTKHGLPMRKLCETYAKTRQRIRIQPHRPQQVSHKRFRWRVKSSQRGLAERRWEWSQAPHGRMGAHTGLKGDPRGPWLHKVPDEQ